MLKEICAEGPAIVELHAYVSITKLRKPAPGLILPALDLKGNPAKVILRVDGKTVAESFHTNSPLDDIY